MSEPVVGAYIVGQTPRPDLTDSLAERFPGVRFEVVGALDGLERGEIPECPPRGYPLETRLSGGARVVVDAAFVEPLLQRAIETRHRIAATSGARIRAHLVLCAGPFPKLAVPGSPSAAALLIRPFEVAAADLQQRRHHRLEVLVPFSDQASPAADKWGRRGFACRVHALTERPHHRVLGEWLAGLTKGTRAQALVIDYVGLPSEALDEIIAAVEVPVFDLGRLALDALERTLARP